MHGILGQTAAIDRLIGALRSQRFHHAWIFAGPRGVGKHITAVKLARILLDPQVDLSTGELPRADADDQTSRLIDAGSHPDLHLIYKELARFSDDSSIRTRKLSNIPLAVLRQFMLGGPVGTTGKYFEPVISHAAAMNHGKVFIIDEAELLDSASQNTLLKTLEEPPANTYIILVTSQASRLLPTVRSRCQLVRFGRLDEAAMETWLARSSLAIDPELKPWVLRLADGSPGVATLAVEYGFGGWQVRIAPMLAQIDQQQFPQQLGAVLIELIEQFATAWVKGDANRSKDAANRDGVGHVLALLAAHARHRLQMACDGGDEATANRWAARIDLLRETEQQVASHVNYKLAIENLIAQWASAPADPLHMAMMA